MRRNRFAWLLGLIALVPASAFAFGGMYVAKADGRLFNQAAKVVLARHDGKTVITMVSDYQGALEEFAVVVPVPSALERGQIHVSDGASLDRLDAYTAPRLVRRQDGDPCQAEAAEAPAVPAARPGTVDALGARVDASFAVGEYDVVILAAEDSDGLLGWLRGNGYRLPDGAEPMLADYVARGMRFVVARVDLEEQSKLGFSYLRPLQIAFESEDLALPIRLGTANAAEAQELTLYLLTREGRGEVVNYPTRALPADVEVPLFVADDFARFYEALFEAEAAASGGATAFLEYAGQTSRCAPCTARPLSADELRQLGAFWLLEAARSASAAPEVFVTRWRLRYDAAGAPADLRFRESGERDSFQLSYTLREPWRGEPRCDAARAYLEGLPARFEAEAQNLARLTRWPLAEIRTKMEANGQPLTLPQLLAAERKWWERLWPDGAASPGSSGRPGRS
jgi:hypothetical protein